MLNLNFTDFSSLNNINQLNETLVNNFQSGLLPLIRPRY